VTKQQQPCVHIYHNFFIHSSVDGHLDCFHVLVIVNSAAVNIGVPSSFQSMDFSGYMPRNGIAESYGRLSPVQSLSRVRLFAILRTTAYQASLSITNSRSPPKPMSIEYGRLAKINNSNIKGWQRGGALRIFIS